MLNLSPRQHEIMNLVALGYSNEHISSILFLQKKTITIYMVDIRDRLDIDIDPRFHTRVAMLLKFEEYKREVENAKREGYRMEDKIR